MNEKSSRFKLSKFNLGFIIAISILSILFVIISVLERVGYRLIMTSIPLFGGIVILFAFVIWGLAAIIRKAKRKMLRLLLGTIFGFILISIGSFIIAYVSQFAQLFLPSEYSVITSPEGRTAVVMIALDTGMNEDADAVTAANERMYLRRDHILETSEEPLELAENEFPAGAYGYVFRAYPRVLGIFYKGNAEVEGGVYRGTESEAKLLYEWTDADTLRLYLENPEVGDEGEAVLHY